MIFVLDRKENMVGVLSNDAPAACPYYDDLHIENIESGVNSYEFSVPASHEMAGKLESNGYVLFKDLDERMQMFQIKQVHETSNQDGYIKQVFAEHVIIPELLTNVVRPVNLTSYTVKQAVEYVLAESDWKAGTVDSDSSSDIEFKDYITVLEALREIMSIFECEIQYEVIFQNGAVSKKLIHVAKKVGTESYKVFSYRKDLDEVVRKEDSDYIVTALIAVGKGDEGGTRLNLKGFTKTEGKYKTEKDNDYIEDTEAVQVFGKKGKHLFGIFIDEAATSQNELFNNALKELKELAKPRITYEAKIAFLERLEGWEAEKVRVGDTVRIFDYSFNPVLLIEARVLEIKRSYTDMEKDELILGDYRQLQLSPSREIDRLKSIILMKENQWAATSYRVDVVSSRGTIFKGAEVATELKAIVYAGNEDITDTLTADRFKWTRISQDAPSDSSWNAANGISKKSIYISNSDIIGSTVFNCEVVI